MNDKKIGATVVLGGGIGGMQAALDLAESGIKVYLVDKSPCIGGVMAQLDKTFPTNDCAMCTMAPKLVEVGRHKDIEIITLADIEKIEGHPGDFTVTVKKNARYIDEDKCTGCGECVEYCPISLLDEYNENLSGRKGIYRQYPQAIPNCFAIKKLGQSPCRSTCPAGQKVQGYIALIREKRYEDAYRVILRDNPFPSVCGRICNHRCEEECTRGNVDESVAIMALKRFVADWAYEHNFTPTKFREQEEVNPVEKQESSKRVAIIGAGPAGLTAAKDLREKGYRVTVFEKLPAAGGMMYVGIPEFRLPRERLQWDLSHVLSNGIELKTNYRIDSLDRLFQDGYDAVFVATGAHSGKKIPFPGANLPGVLVNTDFLREVALGQQVKVGKTTVVLGGGNVAMDVARTALRCGAETVKVACLESREMMPAHSWEIEDAEKEGIEMYPGRSFLEISSSAGKITGIKCINVNFRGFDENGRPDMDIIEGTEHILDADTVIFAIGQGSEISFADEGIEISPRRTIVVDPETLATSKTGVFAGGDVITGTQFVVDAIAAGHKAATSINRYLKGEALKQPEIPINRVKLTTEEIMERITSREKRQSVPVLPLSQRTGFEEVELGLSEEAALAEANRCLNCGICSECFLCVEVCKANAINHNMLHETVRDLHVGAIILSPGFESFNPSLKSEYGYLKYSNVITAIEFERILGTTGPYQGHLLRPSDQTPPRKIAFIQCVGSRDESHDYCSSICCMYATKEAMIAKEHSHIPLECHIYYMDMRAFGKGFDDYYNRAKDLGVKYIRSRPSAVKPVLKKVNGKMEETGNLFVKYVSEDGHIQREEYDLVILSTGITPPESIDEIRNVFGIKLNRYGFCQTTNFTPIDTSREGIFVCGPFSEPKDIPETVTQASGAAGRALTLLADVKGTMITPKQYPPEKDVRGQEPRIGLFVCHCGINIGGVVKVPEVVKYARTLPNVVYAEENLYTCSEDTQAKIKRLIQEHNLNRVVVSSCTPRTHEPLFQETIREAGLNRHLFEMANIRDQCSWIHRDVPEEATEKAKDLVRMAVAKVRLVEPLPRIPLPVTQRALVIGGGPAGMSAALSLANQGFPVDLVEKENRLGGNLIKILHLIDGKNTTDLLTHLIHEVTNHLHIQVHLSSKIQTVEGFVGNYKTTIVDCRLNQASVQLEHGVGIVATGAVESVPHEYLYGKDQRVKTGLEFEKILEESRPEDLPDRVVFIQCVGSREEGHQYCSRVCCTETIKNALTLKRKKPSSEIVVLYRDIRTYGFSESYYRQARDQGIIFLRYEPDEKPVVSAGEIGLEVRIKDLQLGTQLVLPADMLILAARIDPAPDNEILSRFFKIPLNQDGFFLEAHMKLRPVDFATEGMFLAGMAHSPKSLGESIAQGEAAAARAVTIIHKDIYEAEATIASVNEDICSGCGVCVSVCEFEALQLVETFDGNKIVVVNEAVCKGCGCCGGVCPSGAMEQKGFKTEQILAAIEAALL